MSEAGKVEEGGKSEFLLNCWYVAALGEELAGGALVGRTIVNLPVLLFRKEDGSIAAVGNRCPHRFAPLSMGDRRGDIVQCKYHGLGFDSGGRCVQNPHGPIGAVRALSVPSYPAVEQGGIVWLWPGEAEKADPALIPVYGRLSQHDYHVRYGYIHGASHYELMSDNILDLSHIEFLHPILGTDAVSQAKVEVTQNGGAVTTVRRMKNEQLSEGLAQIYATGGQAVDRTLAVTWEAPSNLLLEVTVEPVADQGWVSGSQSLHLFTPETDRTTHYFYASSLPRARADEQTAAKFFDALAMVFATEDKPMIDAQQAMIGSHDIMDLKPALLPIDKAPVLARRELKRRIAVEKKGRSEVPV